MAEQTPIAAMLAGWLAGWLVAGCSAYLLPSPHTSSNLDRGATDFWSYSWEITCIVLKSCELGKGIAFAFAEPGQGSRFLVLIRLSCQQLQVVRIRQNFWLCP